MEKLTKLNAKKVESLEAIKGGRAMQMSSDIADLGDGGGTTTHTPTYKQLLDMYVCDHTPDAK